MSLPKIISNREYGLNTKKRILQAKKLTECIKCTEITYGDSPGEIGLCNKCHNISCQNIKDSCSFCTNTNCFCDLTNHTNYLYANCICCDSKMCQKCVYTLGSFFICIHCSM